MRYFEKSAVAWKDATIYNALKGRMDLVDKLHLSYPAQKALVGRTVSQVDNLLAKAKGDLVLSEAKITSPGFAAGKYKSLEKDVDELRDTVRSLEKGKRLMNNIKNNSGYWTKDPHRGDLYWGNRI